MSCLVRCAGLQASVFRMRAQGPQPHLTLHIAVHLFSSESCGPPSYLVRSIFSILACEDRLVEGEPFTKV